ncbi:MAG: hypothetical protein BJ554DRAFT_1895 [Olpidium bornovanus]|uniref:Uncharacterized protein n=1 Tax=Olpidium bornovanus TaxID=278681 RepID=A0A8H7ZRA9_9FUNG|nr:MAG: hypothetical protein BJ554DRAFT_1895 [Olpidium bornovanus]
MGELGARPFTAAPCRDAHTNCVCYDEQKWCGLEKRSWRGRGKGGGRGKSNGLWYVFWSL